MDYELLKTIKEVQECGKRKANYYLDHGYILLDVQTATRGTKFNEHELTGQQYYARRNPIFVLGRPEGIKQAPNPDREEGQAD